MKGKSRPFFGSELNVMWYLFHWTRLVWKHWVMTVRCQCELDDFSWVWFDLVGPDSWTLSAPSPCKSVLCLLHKRLRCKKEWSLCLSLLKRCLNLKSSQLSYGLERLIFSHVFDRSRAFSTNTDIRERPRLNLKPRRENPSAAHSSSVNTAKQIHWGVVCLQNFV